MLATFQSGLRIFATAAVLALLSSATVNSACQDCIGFVALDVHEEPSFVIARGAVAAAAGDLLGNTADEWVAALPGGGIVVRSGETGVLGTIPDLEARALAVGGGRLFLALQSGIYEMDLVNEDGGFLAAVSARALAAADLDADGSVEVVAALEDGQLLLFDLEDDATYPLGGLRAMAIAGGDFLERGYDQLALLLPNGGVRILDLFQDDAPLCFLGNLGAPAASGDLTSQGFSALPSGMLVAFDAGAFTVIDPESCGVLELDLKSLEVTHGPIFSSASLPTPPAGGQIPGDCNQDGGMDISDAVCLLGHLFLGSPPSLPCGNGSVNNPATRTLLESNGDDNVDLSDAVYILSFLFIGGPPPILGLDCTPIEGCPDVCVR